MPPTPNATLRTVTARGSTDDFRDPVEDDVVFEGTVDAWYDERRRTVTGIGSGATAVSDVFVERSLIIDPMPGNVPLEEGMVVTWDTYDDDLLRSGVITAIEQARHPHVPDYLNTIRLTLEVT